MNELVKKVIITFLSIFISSLILLLLAEYSLFLIFYPYLLGFIIACTIVAVIINIRIAGLWGNALSIFISIMAVGFIWSLVFSKPLANSPLFSVLAVPSSIFSLIIWKIEPNLEKIKTKYRYKRTK
jgi:hypothetical protein